jgi:predicted nucleic acid-binding protein
MIVLDTNVVSELMRPSPSSRVLAWVRGYEDGELYTTAITLAEIRYGIERRADGHRRQLLRSTADDIFGSFAEQVAAVRCEGGAAVRRDRAGGPIDEAG